MKERSGATLPSSNSGLEIERRVRTPSLPSFEKNVYTQYGYYLNYVYNVAEVAEDGVVTVTFAKNANKTHYLATAYNTNDDDKMTGMAKTVVVDLATGTVVDTTATEEEEELQ